MIETIALKFANARPAAKAGLAASMLTLATVAGAATGVLPAAAEEFISDAVEEATGIELPTDASADDAADPTTTDPEATDNTTSEEEEADAEEGVEEGADEETTTDDEAGDGAEEEATGEDDAGEDDAAEETGDPGTGPSADSSGYPNFGSWVSEWAHSADRPEDFGQMVSDEAHRRNEARHEAAPEDAATPPAADEPEEEEAAAAPAPEPEAAAPGAAPAGEPKQRPAAAHSGKSAVHSQSADPGPPSGQGRPAGPGGRK
ncbi:MAG TPA: hypothetical protein VMY88_07945 [Acidimicrobiales bacterium]|nr:hypothetical protein [Acidimicrobiales bacterium]